MVVDDHVKVRARWVTKMHMWEAETMAPSSDKMSGTDCGRRDVTRGKVIICHAWVSIF